MTTSFSLDRSNYLTRPLPSSEDTERAILGGILIDNSVISQALDLKPADFYSPLHRRVFGAMIRLFETSKTIDPILIGEELKKDGSIESIGGVSTITNLTYGLPHFSDLTGYIDVIKDKSMMRNLIRTCSQISSEALEEEDDPRNILDRAQALIIEACTRHEMSDDDCDLADIIRDSLTASERFDERTLIPTGLRDLDYQLGGGLEAGSLVIVAARPSVGKTSAAVSIVDAAGRAGKRTVVFTLETTKRQYMDRWIASKAGINLQDFRTGKSLSTHKEAASSAASNINKMPVSIFDPDLLTPGKLRGTCRRLVAKYKKLDLIVIDYLQLMKSDGRGISVESRRLEIEAFTRSLKLLAKEFGAAVVCLSQLSRAPEKRSPPRPILSDLRESGSIEQDADVVIMLYRPDKEDSSAVGQPAELIVAKHRNGPTGTVKAVFLSTSARFEDMAREVGSWR